MPNQGRKKSVSLLWTILLPWLKSAVMNHHIKLSQGSRLKQGCPWESCSCQPQRGPSILVSDSVPLKWRNSGPGMEEWLSWGDTTLQENVILILFLLPTLKPSGPAVHGPENTKAIPSVNKWEILCFVLSFCIFLNSWCNWELLNSYKGKTVKLWAYLVGKSKLGYSSDLDEFSTAQEHHQTIPLSPSSSISFLWCCMRSLPNHETTLRKTSMATGSPSFS